MKKLLLVVLFFTACGILPQREIRPPEGSWNENVYTSESLGIRFTLPVSWELATPVEIRLMEQSLETMTGDDPDSITTLMMANNHHTDASVRISYQRYRGLTAPTPEQAVAAIMGSLEEMGTQVQNFEPTLVGADLWHTIGTTMRLWGESWYGRTFTAVKNGHIIQITISTHDASETVNAILAMFSDPALPKPTPQLDSALFGAWLDEEDFGRLNFLDDGFLEVGFDSDEQPLEWRVVNDNYLLINGDEILESYTYEIQGYSLVLIDSDERYGTTNFVRDFMERTTSRLDSELFGTWKWDADDSYVYNFYDDGQGSRGFYPNISETEWITDSGELAIYNEWGVNIWNYEIIDGVLKLENHWVEYHYIRAEEAAE
jgi:hypothetical protein